MTPEEPAPADARPTPAEGEPSGAEQVPPWGPQLTPYGAPLPPRRGPVPAPPWPWMAATVVLALVALAAGLEAISKDHTVHTAQRQRAGEAAALAVDQQSIASNAAALVTLRSQLDLAQREFAARGQHENEVYADIAACAAGVTLALTDQNAGDLPAAAGALASVQPLCLYADEAAKKQ